MERTAGLVTDCTGVEAGSLPSGRPHALAAFADLRAVVRDAHVEVRSAEDGVPAVAVAHVQPFPAAVAVDTVAVVDVGVVLRFLRSNCLPHAGQLSTSSA
jgi:hypothetical protein